MDLRTYTTALPRGGMTALAARLGIKPIYLSQLAARQDGREPSPELAVLIERETEGAVRRWDSRPNDWWRIWPELIGVEGAPTTGDVQIHPVTVAAQPVTEAAPPAPGDRRQHDRRVQDIPVAIDLRGTKQDPRGAAAAGGAA